MGALSAKLRSLDGGFSHWCPGCDGAHVIHTTKPNSEGARWHWDGDVVNPTVAPSIRVFSRTDRDGKPLPKGTDRTICHYHLRAGVLQFLNDCEHALGGTNVPLPDFD
jgi:hypothetical protein